MNDLLNEYIHEYDKQTCQSDDTTMNLNIPSIKSLQEDKCEFNEQDEYERYIEKTKEYYYKMSCRDFFRALWFTMSSCYICASEYTKYKIGWKSRNNAIIDVSKRLASINMMYVKIFQAFATNRNIVSQELNEFFSEYTDNVEYTDEEYDIKELKELEERSVECAPYRRLRILNNYKPIKSGLMSLIFKGVIERGDTEIGEEHIKQDDDNSKGEEEIVVKYLRKNISKNFNKSMNNLVVFAKFTGYFQYLQTLNIENLILQNIVSLSDQVCFRKELANIKLYYRSWNNYKYVKIPKPYADYTEKINPDVVVMEYINGMKITEIDPEDNDEFGKVLAAFNTKAAFCTSFFHGDLHPGNILFIKNDPSSELEKYQISLLDYGIIGHLSSTDQEILFRTVKYMYKRRFIKVIDMITKFDLSEPINAYENSLSLDKDVEKMNRLRNELTEVLVRYTTPEIRFFGVTEIYEINFILNSYNLRFKRSLYRLFMTLAIMDSIGTRLGTKLSYLQHMTDMVVELFNIDLNCTETDSETEPDSDTEPETDSKTETDGEPETETDTDTDGETEPEPETETDGQPETETDGDNE